MKTFRTCALLTTALAGWPAVAAAQTAPAGQQATAPQGQDATQAAEQDDAAPTEIVVVGSRITGTSITEALPVTVVDSNQIAATGAVSGDELLRSIPQMGDVSFNPNNSPQTSNAARGDVSSIDIRDLGPGNTLVLINGRRLVQHPVTQAGIANVPEQTFNANSLPVGAIERVEVLRDGAAAIYGSDAVAGVVNVVTTENYQGLRGSLRYGGAEGTHMREFNANLAGGTNFGNGRGNITVMGEYTHRTAMLASDESYTATGDLRGYFAGYPGYADSTDPDNRSSYTPFANFSTNGVVVRQGSRTLTSGAGSFHIQPQDHDGCRTNLSDGMCIGRGNISYNTFRDLRFDDAVGTTVRSQLERINLFATTHYDVSDTLTLFGEAGYYHATSHRLQPAVIRLNDVTVPASNYWNPFGATTLPDGSPNPNRLPGLDIPDEGIPVTLTRYRFVDTGLQNVDVTNDQWRLLGGARGSFDKWDWEVAGTYSEATSEDLSDNINTTLLQQQLALATPDAYNPFNGGGCDGNYSVGDCTPSSAASYQPFLFRMRRFDRTTLAMFDARISTGQLIQLPAGDLGLSIGMELRRETQRDDRDPNLDGTNTFTDMVTGETNESNVVAVSPTPDSYGSRRVFSAYGELAVPVISPAMGVPLIRKLELQLAGRYENYSDFGSIFRPKAAAAWDVFKGVRLRGSFALGFRAPNLEQLHAGEYGRLGTNNDYIRCEADLRAGRISNFNQCSEPASYSIRVAGNPDLQPERSQNVTFGLVLQPGFIPDLTFTVDWWQIKQNGIVGQFGGSNSLALDYLQQIQGASNPNVVRAAPTADDVAFFAGTGIDPVGEVIGVNDSFVNLLPQTARGIDYGVRYTLRDHGLGRFEFNLNVAQLLKFKRDRGDLVDILFDARDAGTIDAGTPLSGGGNLLANNGRPKWKGTASLTWSLNGFRIGASAQYTGSVHDTSFLSDTGQEWVVPATTMVNLYVQYRIRELGPLEGLRFRIGARNVFDTQPPLTADGYFGELYQPYGRYIYTSVGFDL
ncbi:TonB-dependent receptor domain-containing protein [Sphingosinithalassobacter portus]|uniref:TonB-dependent receptor domain-containing protein n=1 Tax=Stakelama portus TaxID=2676234 RepID=UPI000D6E6219|nr:TonB-dependent receptor [Sphingosinithalassobacter portus]